MDKLFWVIPAGTLASRPGPDQAPWDLAALRAGGMGAILSVNDGLLCHPQDCAVAGITYACMPLSANAPPHPGDEHICLRVLPQAYAFVQAQMGQGGVVHCSGGKDRTGLFLGSFFMQHGGLSPQEALQAVRQVRPIALSAPGWEALAQQVLHCCM